MNTLISRIRTSRLSWIAGLILIIVLFAIGFRIGAALEQPSATQSAPPALDGQPATVAGGAAIVNPPHRLQDFTLTSHTGQPISLSDLRGRVVLLMFGYTHCPRECPLTLAYYKQVKQMLGRQAQKVAFVFVSVDGKRDTPDVIARYLKNFDADFIGMTGSEDALRALGREYGLIFERQAPEAAEQKTHENTEPAHVREGHHHSHGGNDVLDSENENYFLQHTSPSFLIDAQGYLRLVYFYGAAPEAMSAGIEQVLGSD